MTKSKGIKDPSQFETLRAKCAGVYFDQCQFSFSDQVLKTLKDAATFYDYVILIQGDEILEASIGGGADYDGYYQGPAQLCKFLENWEGTFADNYEEYREAPEETGADWFKTNAEVLSNFMATLS